MGLSSIVPISNPKFWVQNPEFQTRAQSALSSNTPSSQLLSLTPTSISSELISNSFQNINFPCENSKISNISDEIIPSMSEIIEASRTQKLDIQLRTVGPFFRITAKSLVTENELGRAEGLVRIWVRGKILHLDSIRLRRETLGMEKSIFGIGLFIGAVAIRYGYDCGCKTAELLAISDSDPYHSKVLFFLSALSETKGCSFTSYAFA